MTKKKVYMARETRANYFKIGLALVGISTDEQTADLLMTMCDEITKKEGRFSIHDAVRVKLDNERFYKEIELSKTKTEDK